MQFQVAQFWYSINELLNKNSNFIEWIVHKSLNVIFQVALLVGQKQVHQEQQSLVKKRYGRFFFKFYTDYYRDKNHIKIFCWETWAEKIFGWFTLKIIYDSRPFILHSRCLPLLLAEVSNVKKKIGWFFFYKI